MQLLEVASHLAQLLRTLWRGREMLQPLTQREARECDELDGFPDPIQLEHCLIESPN